MTESNTKNIDAKSENVKHTTLDSYKIFPESHVEDLVFPRDVLDKWKRKLENMRSRVDNNFETKQPPVRRPVNDQRLHEVFRDIMDEDSLLVLEKKTNFDYKKSVEKQQLQTSENNSKFISTGKMSNDSQKSKDGPSKVEKTNRTNVKEADVNSIISNTKNNFTTKNHIASATTKTRPKKL